jgi:hypothetical protein
MEACWKMRGSFAPAIATAAIAIAAIVASSLPARSEEILTLDVRPVCRGIAAQSADPGVGQGAQADTYQRCLESEQAVHDELKQKWSSFSAADKRHCVGLAKTGGESSHTELLTCLEMARDVRQLRAAAAARNEAADTKPAAAPPPAPSAQPAPAGAASQTTAAKEPPKTPGDSAAADIDRAKAEAQTAKASQALAEKKLADAEAALALAKQDAGRAAAEAEQAKAAAQAAKESEATVKRKLADVEAARAAAAQACNTRPGLVGRVRGWLKRPGSKNP